MPRPVGPNQRPAVRKCRRRVSAANLAVASGRGDVRRYEHAGINSLLMAAHSEPLRELMQQKLEWGTWLAKKVGSSAGGIGYEIEGADGRPPSMRLRH